MIGPGWLPGTRLRPTLRKRTLAYMPARRRARPRANKQAPLGTLPNTEPVLFDHRFAEFPVAHAVPHEPRARAIALAAALERWLAARWLWLRPRTVPCAVAALGMIAVIAFSNYLANLDDDQGSTTNTQTTVSTYPSAVQVVPSYIAH